MIGNRTTKQIITAALERRHYTALARMRKLYPNFLNNLWRYLTGRGDYPYDIKVRTPVGLTTIRLYSHHDLLTVNEIFCRQDYFADTSLNHVLDLGSNIGISALYFLTRNTFSKAFLYEPDPKNIEKLKKNLRGFEDRYILSVSAVSDQSGELEFGTESTGRYGGIGLKTASAITVRCIHISDAIISFLQHADRMDILKIDTEGVEIQSVNAIERSLLSHVSTIYLEASPSEDILPLLFDNTQYGAVRQLVAKSGTRDIT